MTTLQHERGVSIRDSLDCQRHHNMLDRMEAARRGVGRTELLPKILRIEFDSEGQTPGSKCEDGTNSVCSVPSSPSPRRACAHPFPRAGLPPRLLRVLGEAGRPGGARRPGGIG